MKRGTQDKKKLVNRLHRVEGQIRGIEKMVDDDKYCIDIITQLAAATTALDQIGLKVIDDHVRGCVKEALASGNKESEKKVEELLASVERYARMR